MRSRRRNRHGIKTWPSIEPLESRALLNASTPASSILVVKPNETINLAQDLGTLIEPVSVVGSIGNGPAGSADVTWFHFHLDDAERVELEVTPPAGKPPFASVLSLFNNDPQDFNDPYDLDGHRLLTQVTADPSDGVADESQDLGPGDYFVAVSGAGNLDFSPVIAGSGYDGATGDYELTIRATDLGLSGDGPTVLSSDPKAGSVLPSSPLAIRLDMSGPLDPNTILPGQTVELFDSSNRTTGDALGSPVALASVNFSAAADELQLFPLAPLEPGVYVLRLAGNSSGGQTVLADPNGLPLGEDAEHPAGSDEYLSFAVDGVDGVVGATTSDDTAATARNLGDVAGDGIVQVSGAIGVDPTYNPGLSDDPTSPEPQFDPANQVDLYHFQITGPGRYAMLAEVFAGRIGSPLDPGVSLWELDPSDGQLVFLAGNNNTLDATQGTDGSIPLFTDSALNFGLTAGDYYLAVAGGSNTPSPLEGQPPGSPGLLDPNQTHSAQLGWSTGPYVLNLLVQPATKPPRVVASSPVSGQVFDQAPTQLTVQFSEPVNIQQLAYQAFEMSDQESLPEVFVEGPDGTDYYPRLLSYDQDTNTATFQMLDGLANGSYALHLSGPGGLADFGGNPLAGNDPSGDDVIPFTVRGPDRGVSGNMTDGYSIASQVGQANAQQIGILFPDEIQAGVTITRGPESGVSSAPDSMQDEYVIKVLQTQSYSFTLSGNDLPEGIQVTVESASGRITDLSPSFNQLVFFAPLTAGTYTVIVSGWFPTQSASLSYQLTLGFFGQQDNAPPLVDGPAPALQISLDGVASGAGLTLSGGSGAGGSGAGDSGAGSSGGGGSLTASSAGLPALNFVQVQSEGGLTGLGMNPLGGVSGGEAGSAVAAPVQVALNLPMPTSPVFNRLAVNLVMLTQMISLNPGGEGIAATEPLDPPAAEMDDEPVPAATSSTTPQEEPSAEPGKVLLAAEATPTTIHQPTPSREILIALAESAVPGGPIAVWKASASHADSATAATTAVAPDEPDVASGTWVTRLVIAGAILMAVRRARGAVRGLEWKKRACATRIRSGGTIAPHRVHAGTTLAPLVVGTAHPLWSRSRRRAKAAGTARY
jgi:methionine-rich copper-binding protein CopC